MQTNIFLTKLLQEMRPGVLPMTPKQSDRVWMGWWDIPSAKESEISKVPHQNRVDNFFRLSRHSAQRIRTRGKNSKCRILYRSNGSPPEVHSAGSSSCVLLSRFFFLLHNNAPAHKAASVSQFLTPKTYYNTLSPPILSRFVTARLFYVPQDENEVKRTPLCGCCWDPKSCNWWIKEGPKNGNFRQLLRNCTTTQKPVYMPMELILNLKKGMCLRFKKKISCKSFGQHCVYSDSLINELIS